MSWWTTDDTSKSGNITVHSPDKGTSTGVSVPHINTVYIDGVPHSTTGAYADRLSAHGTRPPLAVGGHSPEIHWDNGGQAPVAGLKGRPGCLVWNWGLFHLPGHSNIVERNQRGAPTQRSGLS